DRSETTPRDTADSHNLGTQDDPMQLFPCSICHKIYRHRRTLKEHMRIHTGEKLHECELCLKRFLKRAHLTEHVRIHTGEKPYECEICLMRFRCKSIRTDHIRRGKCNERKNL
ncbi:unnamed protein product, partial [Owenia fusiformis]